MSMKVHLYPTDKHKKKAVNAIYCRIWHSHLTVASFLLDCTNISMLHCTIAAHVSNGLVGSNAPIRVIRALPDDRSIAYD